MICRDYSRYLSNLKERLNEMRIISRSIQLSKQSGCIMGDMLQQQVMNGAATAEWLTGWCSCALILCETEILPQRHDMRPITIIQLSEIVRHGSSTMDHIMDENKSGIVSLGQSKFHLIGLYGLISPQISSICSLTTYQIYQCIIILKIPTDMPTFHLVSVSCV